jgi:hypothetical protein
MKTEKEIKEEPNNYSYPQIPPYFDRRPCAKLSPHPSNPDMLVDEKKGIFYVIVQKVDFDSVVFELQQLNHEEGFVIEDSE